MTALKIATDNTGEGVTVLTLEGELDAHSGPALRESIIESFAEGTSRLIVDMSAVPFIDSVGVGILVGAMKRAREIEGNLSVVCDRSNILRIFVFSVTRQLLNVVPSLDEAQRMLAIPSGCEGDEA